MSKDDCIERFRHHLLGHAVDLMLCGLGRPAEKDAGIALAQRIDAAQTAFEKTIGAIWDAAQAEKATGGQK